MAIKTMIYMSVGDINVSFYSGQIVLSPVVVGLRLLMDYRSTMLCQFDSLSHNMISKAVFM